MVTAAQTSQQQLYQQGRPEIATIRLNRGSGGIGLSIVAAQVILSKDFGVLQFLLCSTVRVFLYDIGRFKVI